MAGEFNFKISVGVNERGIITEICRMVLCPYADLEFRIKLLASER